MIILSFLGTTKLDETEYIWDTRIPQSTDSFLVALSVWFPKADIYILETEKAKESNGVAARAKLPNARFIPIPNGRSDDENWQIFNTLAEALPEDAELVFDITNGFRSLPILSMLVVSFLRSVKKLNLKHLVYAAFERGVTPTPVFDLTPFVTMLDWANATNRFLETGDARKLQPLIQTQGQRPLSDNLNATAKLLEPLSQALALIRPIDTAHQAHEITERIEKARSERWAVQHEPFKLILERLEKTITPLAATDSNSESILSAQYQQILWYDTHNQHEKASALAREWLVSIRIWKQGKMLIPIDDQVRKNAEDWLNKCSHNTESYDAEWVNLIKYWRNLADLRNDLMHCGMRKEPRKLINLPTEVHEKIIQLRGVVAPLGLELPEVSQ